MAPWLSALISVFTQAVTAKNLKSKSSMGGYAVFLAALIPVETVTAWPPAYQFPYAVLCLIVGVVLVLKKV